MANEEKISIVEKLFEAKAITFREALKLLEIEKEYIYNQWPIIYPSYPVSPVQPSWELPVVFTYTN